MRHSERSSRGGGLVWWWGLHEMGVVEEGGARGGAGITTEGQGRSVGARNAAGGAAATRGGVAPRDGGPNGLGGARRPGRAPAGARGDATGTAGPRRQRSREAGGTAEEYSAAPPVPDEAVGGCGFESGARRAAAAAAFSLGPCPKYWRGARERDSRIRCWRAGGGVHDLPRSGGLLEILHYRNTPWSWWRTTGSTITTIVGYTKNQKKKQ